MGIDEGAFDAKVVVAQLVELMARVVGPSSNTYPMFDDSTTGLLRAMVKEGKVEGVQLGPATQVGIAGHFISALEAFPDAPMDVVLDARTRLRKPLIGFRSAIITMAERVEATPIDATFPRLVDDLYSEHVAPALLQLEAVSRELRVREALRRELLSGTGVKELGGAAMGIAASSVATLPDIAQVLATGGGAGLAVKGAVDVAGAIY
ncbi:hypothetical protein BH20CHL6_BH20CHL6_03990 [soil metagenome]